MGNNPPLVRLITVAVPCVVPEEVREFCCVKYCVAVICLDDEILPLAVTGAESFILVKPPPLGAISNLPFNSLAKYFSPAPI